MHESPTTRPSLLLRLRNSADDQAWVEFVDLYAPLVRRVARRGGLQDADAADLEQEVFRAVAGAISRYDPDPAKGSFRGWLLRIARNSLLNLLAARRRHPGGGGGTDMLSLLEAVPDPKGEDSTVFEAEYRHRTFEWAAGQVRDEFKPATWQAFWRTAVDNQAVAAVAAELGLSAGAVYVARSRVLARIRAKVEELEGGSESPTNYSG
jgi:RNA polymerase sigma-70 factor (ECF subfamily)